MTFVARGSCRCLPSSSRTRRRQRLNQSVCLTPTKSSLVLVVDDEAIAGCSAIICQWCHVDADGRSLNESLDSGSLLAYDDHVRIVTSSAPSVLEEEDQALARFLHELQARNQWWSLGKPLQEDVQRCYGRANLTDRPGMSCSHRHARLSKQGSQQRVPFMIPFTPEWGILPLQSLVISIYSHTSSMMNTIFDPLLHACWKRQLTGKVVAHGGLLTSTIRLHIPATTYSKVEEKSGIESEIFCYIESLTSTPVDGRNTATKNRDAPPPGFYVILPSTRITVRHAAANTLNDDITPSKDLTDNATNPPSIAARLLIETMDCMRARKNVPRAFLLSGPPGVGKTFSVAWAWNKAKGRKGGNSPTHKTILRSLRGSELLQNSNPAQSLEREFLAAVQVANDGNDDNDVPVVLIFLDECDALVSVGPVAAMLADLLDRVGEADDPKWKNILVVGATNLIESVPSYLRRAGRFDREIPMAPPTAKERIGLLSTLLAQAHNMSGSESPFGITDQELQEIAEKCVGYVPADLSALVRKAWLLSFQDETSNASWGITYAKLDAALDLVGASALRDASLAAAPKISWEAIAGDPGGAKTALRQAIEWPRLKSKQFATLGLVPPRGILLHGPPGCAKTTLARAAAGASGVAFLSLSPAQVYASSFVGEAEAVVRRAFTLARSAAPCILFFDEIDSIFGGNGDIGSGNDKMGGGRGSSAEARVLSTFLNEMDGVDTAGAGKDGVLVLGATNRPWMLDSALLRPGRLGDKVIFLPPPDEAARYAILEMQFSSLLAHAQNEVDKWDWDYLMQVSKGMTGAELVGACQDAKMQWIRETILVKDDFPGISTAEEPKESAQFRPELLMNALESVKPILSNPRALQEFGIFTVAT